MSSSGQPQEPVREILSHVEPAARTPGQREAQQEGWAPAQWELQGLARGRKRVSARHRGWAPCWLRGQHSCCVSGGARGSFRAGRGREGVSKPLRQRGSGHPGARGGGQPRPEPHAGSSFPPIQQGSSLTRRNPSLQRSRRQAREHSPVDSAPAAPAQVGCPPCTEGRRGSGLLPVSHLGPSQAGHGLLQVLAQIQDVLHSPLSLGLRVWREERSWVSGQGLLPSWRRPEAAPLDKSWDVTLPLRPS